MFSSREEICNRGWFGKKALNVKDSELNKASKLCTRHTDHAQNALFTVYSRSDITISDNIVIKRMITYFLLL